MKIEILDKLYAREYNKVFPCRDTVYNTPDGILITHASLTGELDSMIEQYNIFPEFPRYPNQTMFDEDLQKHMTKYARWLGNVHGNYTPCVKVWCKKIIADGGEIATYGSFNDEEVKNGTWTVL